MSDVCTFCSVGMIGVCVCARLQKITEWKGFKETSWPLYMQVGFCYILAMFFSNSALFFINYPTQVGLAVPKPRLPTDSRVLKIAPVSPDLAFADIRLYISCTKSSSSLSGRVWVCTIACVCHKRVLFHAHVVIAEGSSIVFVKLFLGLSISAVVLVLVLRTIFRSLSSPAR